MPTRYKKDYEDQLKRKIRENLQKSGQPMAGKVWKPAGGKSTKETKQP